MKLSYSPYPGMLVHCVDDEFDGVARFVIPSLPHRGFIYTIREVVARGEDAGFLLKEFRNPPVSHGGWVGEPCFLAERFVPVDPRALDVFRKQEVEA